LTQVPETVLVGAMLLMMREAPMLVEMALVEMALVVGGKYGWHRL
jgi:hypothetical protein